MIKDFLRKKLSDPSRRKLRNLVRDVKAFGSGGNLTKLGRIYGTDKVRGHFYTPHYQAHFRPFKYKRVKLLEIGVGGYEHPHAGGESLRMWKKYFPFGQIYSLDIHDKSFHREKRIRIFRGSQADRDVLQQITEETGPLDIIIDDGSHINRHVIETFKLLFPVLKKGGIYVVEDTQTSYWEKFGGDSEDLNNPETTMNFFKGLIDGLNHKEFLIPGYEPDELDRTIVSMHFYHNLIFIYKGDNDAESNMVVDNERLLEPRERRKELFHE